ncbi:hypothetical protein PchlO6_2756 [Pseudomonas chlororaphis O6]|uniref:Uncharacterized protein n=1 Tax=Pseudomonas chlororaphis O6 TaxID=1037915 RepID=A0AB33WR88_9PSED|nr:hypothetical protein PchlO6_2756 [Pseudomonas chlororaphis O6]
MRPAGVVARDVALHIRSGLMLRAVACFRHPLRFQTAKETLHRGVVSAFALTTHALPVPMFQQLISELMAGVLAALIGRRTFATRLFVSAMKLEMIFPTFPKQLAFLSQWRRLVRNWSEQPTRHPLRKLLQE